MGRQPPALLLLLLLAFAACGLLPAPVCLGQEVTAAASSGRPDATQANPSAAAAAGASSQAPKGKLSKAERKRQHRAAAARHAKLKQQQAEATAADAATAAPKAEASRASKRKGLTGEELAAAVQKAEKAQKNRDDHQAVVLSQLIDVAPAAELAAGDGDISTTGKCRSEIDMFCLGMEPGERRLADCLQAQLAAEAGPDFSGPKQLTEGCRAELDAFMMDAATNINKNLPLAKACEKDVKRRCRHVTGGNGEVLSCLRGNPDVLRQSCYDEVFKAEKQAADDIRTDAPLYEACKADIDRKCKNTKPEEGKVQRCLRRHKGGLGWSCREQLFRQSMENADDVRLNTLLFQTCLDDKKKFCADVEPGHSRALDCLEAHREEPGFSADCKGLIESTLAERAVDFRLDPTLRHACARDIERTCGIEEDMVKEAVAGGDDASVINCLQDYRDELRRPECKAAVRRSIERGAEDIRFGARLGIACWEDRQNFCSSVPPGSARVIRCLQSRRQQLSSDCKAAMFDEETTMGESIDFQYPMKTACQEELVRFCKDVPHQNARAIRCLQDNFDKPQFSGDCRSEVALYEQRLGSDYRLDSRLEVQCRDTIKELCSAVRCADDAPCGGAMLRCLTTNLANVTDGGCQQEVEYYEKMEVRDFRNDIILAENCREDVDIHCKKVKKGGGRIHQCLRKNLSELSEGCRKEEERLMAAAADNVELQPSLASDCAAERQEHCADVRPGSSRIYNCLVASADQVDFSDRCRANLAGQQVLRLKDWRMDFNLRTVCADDVAAQCQEATQATKTQGQVLECLVANMPSINPPCGREVVRTVHSGLMFYQPDLPVLRACDGDVVKHCVEGADQKQKDWAAGRLPGKGKSGAAGRAAAEMGVGQVRRCLEEHSPQMGTPSLDMLSGLSADAQIATEEAPEEQPAVEPLSEQCGALVALGRPGDFQGFVADFGSGRLASQLRAMEARLHLPEDSLVRRSATVEDDGTTEVRDALTLTGWGALAGMFSLVAVVLGGAGYAWKRWSDARYGGYEVVMKSRPPRTERSVELQ